MRDMRCTCKWARILEYAGCLMRSAMKVDVNYWTWEWDTEIRDAYLDEVS